MTDRTSAQTAHTNTQDGAVNEREALLAANAELKKALEAIMAEPHGCQFCDSGKLRDQSKTHAAACGFALAEKVLAGGRQ